MHDQWLQFYCNVSHIYVPHTLHCSYPSSDWLLFRNTARTNPLKTTCNPPLRNRRLSQRGMSLSNCRSRRSAPRLLDNFTFIKDNMQWYHHGLHHLIISAVQHLDLSLILFLQKPICDDISQNLRFLTRPFLSLMKYSIISKQRIIFHHKNTNRREEPFLYVQQTRRGLCAVKPPGTMYCPWKNTVVVGGGGVAPRHLSPAHILDLTGDCITRSIGNISPSIQSVS